MLAALLVCAAIVLAAAAPGVALAVGDLSAAQDAVGDARLAVRATALAADLADERDDLAVSVAAGQPATPTADQQRTDRQVADVTGGGRLSADLRTALATLPAVRRSARAASSAPAAVAAYQPLVDAVGRAAGPVTAPLGRATAAAAVQRGLLVAGLTAGGDQHGLVADAQAARLQEQAALAEFHATAPAGVRTDYDQTVTGADTAEADRDLNQLLGGGELTSADRALGAKKVGTALAARLSLMRGVESSAATDEAATAASHRDHEVTVLELRAALAALCLILLLAVLVTLFRTLTRPLAALHRWSRADPESGQGAEAIGADEFAAVARRINALTHEAQALRTRAGELAAERAESAAAHTALAAEHQAALVARAELARTRDDLMRSREEIAERLNRATARNAVQVVHVNLSLRTLGLIERQLTLIEGMEEHEQDPERLATLFRLDHLATRMRRNSENLLVLTGTEHSHGAAARPVPLIDVARAALSEVERYERVRILAMPEADVAGRAADDVSHLIAELLDNAAAFSAPTAEVRLNGWVMESGEVMVAVEDSGIGVPPERIDELNALLVDPDPAPPSAAAGLGLYVVARLAHRHGVRVQLRPHANGGTTAVAVLPRLLVPTVDPLARVLPGQRGASPEPGYGAVPDADAGYGAGLGGDYGAEYDAVPGGEFGAGLGAEHGAGGGIPVPALPSEDRPPVEQPFVEAHFAEQGTQHAQPEQPVASAPLAPPVASAPPEPSSAEQPAGGLPPLARRVRQQPAPDHPVLGQQTAEPALPQAPLPERRPPAQTPAAFSLPGQQTTDGPGPDLGDPPAEPRVRVERLRVPPARMSSTGLPDMQVQPLTAEPAAAPEPPLAPRPAAEPPAGSAPGAVPPGGAVPPAGHVPSVEHARAEYAPRHAATAPPPPLDPGADGADGTLPRRVRKASGIRAAAQDGRRRTEPLDAEGLRRKLAGLQRGLRDGRRDAELETRGATETTAARPATATSPGDTVEEATR
ncbi:nitrate- and nitrite sensing domain-containing protein [Streptomyces sp. NPDC087270]|uniref:sensor histidine kinase n=1 Tax=Streptomyces sp. NPDC087270 TaxID=3365774 RepID=UPI003803D35B